MKESTKTALSVAFVVVIAVAFWMLLLSPKREKADELSEHATTLSAEVSSERSRVEAGNAAKEEFPALYQQLVVMGKAVPADAATPSLLVQLNGVSGQAETSFVSIQGGGETEAGAASESGELLPLGAGEGPVGFSSMPYTLEFEGGFFDIANFIQGIDSLVKTKDGYVDADGRLITIDGFNLAPSGEEEGGSPSVLKASFSVSTYVTPPGQGLTAGATSAGPEEASAP